MIAAGLYHSLALCEGGTVAACGSNYYGQLGDGTRTDRSAPVAVLGLSGVHAIAAGEWYSLALCEDGTVMACGWDIYGRLGDGTETARITPVAEQ